MTFFAPRGNIRTSIIFLKSCQKHVIFPSNCSAGVLSGRVKKSAWSLFQPVMSIYFPTLTSLFLLLGFFCFVFFFTVAHPLGTNLYPLSLPSLLFPLKSKMTAIIFSKKILRTRWPKLRCSAD